MELYTARSSTVWRTLSRRRPERSRGSALAVLARADSASSLDASSETTEVGSGGPHPGRADRRSRSGCGVRRRTRHHHIELCSAAVDDSGRLLQLPAAHRDDGQRGSWQRHQPASPPQMAEYRPRPRLIAATARPRSRLGLRRWRDDHLLRVFGDAIESIDYDPGTGGVSAADALPGARGPLHEDPVHSPSTTRRSTRRSHGRAGARGWPPGGASTRSCVLRPGGMLPLQAPEPVELSRAIAQKHRAVLPRHSCRTIGCTTVSRRRALLDAMARGAGAPRANICRCASWASPGTGATPVIWHSNHRRARPRAQPPATNVELVARAPARLQQPHRRHSSVRARPSRSAVRGANPTSSRRRVTSATSRGGSPSRSGSAPSRSRSGRPVSCASVSTTRVRQTASPEATLTAPVLSPFASAAKAAATSSTCMKSRTWSPRVVGTGSPASRALPTDGTSRPSGSPGP